MNPLIFVQQQNDVWLYFDNMQWVIPPKAYEAMLGHVLDFVINDLKNQDRLKEF